MNQIVISGNVGQEPKTRMAQNGGAVASFSVASHRPYKDKQGQTQYSDTWMNVVAFGVLAESVGKDIHKGTKVIVAGRVQVRSYDSNGQKKWVTEIVADEIGPLLPKARPQNNFGGFGGQGNSGGFGAPDIPFN